MLEVPLTRYVLSDQVQGRALGALLLEDEKPAGLGAGQSQARLHLFVHAHLRGSRLSRGRTHTSRSQVGRRFEKLPI